MRKLLIGGLLCLLFGHLRAQIVNIEEYRITGTNDTTHWYGHLKGSGSVAKVKQQSLQFNAEARIQFKKDPHLILWLLNSSLLRAGDQNFQNQVFAHTRYNYKLSERWTAEAYAQIQSNPLQELNSRKLIGSGIRYRALKSGNGRQRMYLGASDMVEENIFTAPYPSNTRHRFSSYASITFRVGTQATLYSTSYWQPVWGLIKNYRFSSDWNLAVTIAKKVSLTSEFIYNYDSGLPETATASSYLWRNGLMWRF